MHVISTFQSLDAVIASHEPTVSSLNEAAQKLVASNTADNTAEIEHDIADLNEKCVTTCTCICMHLNMQL